MGGGAVFDVDNQLLMMILLSVSFVFAGIGIFFFVSSGIVWASFEKLLQEGDYSKVKKKNQSAMAAISASYWLITTAIYLGYSLATNQWEYSWVIWVVTGVVFPAIVMIANLLSKRKRSKLT